VTNGLASTTKTYSLTNVAFENPVASTVSASGGFTGGNGPIFSSTSSVGQVLGASTTAISELLKQLKELYKLLFTLQLRAASCSYTWSKDLTLFDANLDVKNLQTALNFSTMTTVATSGNGSVGHETIYFGNATKNAVIKLQNIFYDEISDNAGYVGSSTRAVLNKICKI
jgi:hypothetical protein